jgi:hypothetical protein
MSDRKHIESLPYWHGTYRNTRTGAIECLMRTISGGYFWWSVDYQGIPAGATREFMPGTLAHAERLGILVLDSGSAA